MPIAHNAVDLTKFNRDAVLPFELHKDGIRKLREAWIYRSA